MALTAGLTLLAWWLIRRYLENQGERPEEYPISLVVKEPSGGDAVTVTGARPTPDDLRRIEGIGPKIASVLAGAGVVSFAQLADTATEQLRQMLSDGGVRIAYPDTWPEQAALAAAGQWEELALLQSQLVRGRRVTRQE
jgi:predicted flap endonuclease-1-like 5' DNA nuclease